MPFASSDALAIGLNLQAADYTDLVAAGARVGRLAAALTAAAQGTAGAGAAVTALSRLATALPSGGARIPVARVVDLGDAAALSPMRGAAGGRPPPRRRAGRPR